MKEGFQAGGVAALAGLVLATTAAAPAAAQVFEVIHPEVERGAFEFEQLNGFRLDSVETGDERSGHEIALGYAPVSFWMPTLAVEIANPEEEKAEVEALEVENVFVFPFGNGAHADHGHGGGYDDDDDVQGPGYALGFYAALEIPNEGGIDQGAASFGPIGEVRLGLVDVIGNLFVETPFSDGQDPGLAYAFSAAAPVGGGFSLGAEAFGDIEEAFGDAPGFEEQEHLLGPAIYTELDLGRGRVLEPRLAALFGLSEAAPDAALSLNIEMKF